MANFDAALKKTLDKWEGFPGFSIDNNKFEVCAGINREYWPGWVGWQTVDAIKAKVGNDKKAINAALAKDATLYGKVSDFYKRSFWTPSLEVIADQDLAWYLFDKGIQCGIRQANKFIQRALGVPDDGIIGAQTMLAIKGSNPVALLAHTREQAKEFYRALHAKDPVKYPTSMIERA
jgi:hypothetical protein